MILYEYEGKQLFSQAGIIIPKSQLLHSPDEQITLEPPFVLKAQVLSGKRADAGGIVIVKEKEGVEEKVKDLFGKTINKEKVEMVLVEEMIEHTKEFYLALSYNTDLRLPVLSISKSGGTGIEERGVEMFPISPIQPMENLPSDLDRDFLEKVVNVFFEQDCLLLEINPLVETPSRELVVLDAKVKLDDTASARHPDWDFPPRSVPGHTATPNEIAAKKIDEGDYRGTAGSAYFDIEGGDIAILSSGGGVSLTAMDALTSVGGKPANFTEYSGNPPKEKVAKLTEVVLSKPNIHGLWVIGTVVANFTDIYETLSGLIEGLRLAEKELGRKFDFPIVIRRGGPREDEAFEMLRNIKDFDIHICDKETSILESAQLMAKLAQTYERNKLPK